MFCFCAHSRHLARTLTARYDAALAPANLTAAQFETLSRVRTLGPTTGRALAEKLALDKTTLSRNLRPLIDARLLAAHPGKDDARQIFYAVTAKGTQRLAKAMPLWQGAHQQSLAMLGSQAASAERALKQMTQTL